MLLVLAQGELVP